MATEIIKITAQIVISHASMSELSPQELVGEIKEIYNLLASLEGGAVIPEIMAPEKAPEGEVGKKPPIPLKDIVTQKYVVCLECGKKMRTLKAHLRKSHKLSKKEYCQMYGLDPKKFPLVCGEYSKQRSQMAKDRGFGKAGGRKKKKAGA
ncbi:MAG: MucR family transcriptional regulator [Desulfobaccales bacterium]